MRCGHRLHPNNLQMLHVIFTCLFAVRPLFSLELHAGMAEAISIVKFTRVEWTMEITFSAGCSQVNTNWYWVDAFLSCGSVSVYFSSSFGH